MQTAKIASIAFMALIFPVAALVLPIGTRAASGNVQVCQPSSSCQVGEFLYDDEYSPITSATCTITSRNPDGTLLLNASAMTASAQGDGWYYKDVSTPATEGLYRTQVCCTAGSDYLCLDKSFEVKVDAAVSGVADAVWNADRSAYNTAGSFGEVMQNVMPSTSDIASATWGYSNRSLSTFGDLVTSVWNYSSRSSSADLGDLVANIWGYSDRTLTGADLDSGSLAMKTDVSGSTTINNISAEIGQTNNLLEQIIKKPILESSLENGPAVSLESKIDETKKVTAQLNSRIKYIKSKAGYIDSKWVQLSDAQVLKSIADINVQVGSKATTNQSSVLGVSTWIESQWKWQEIQAVQSQAKALQVRLSSLQSEIDKKGKTARAKNELKAIILAADKIQALMGNNASSSKSKTVFNRLNEVIRIVQSYQSKSLELGKLYASLGQGEPASYDKQTEQLSRDVAAVNFIPKVQKSILAKPEPGEKGLKNKILGLLGMIDANKQFLAKKPGDAMASTWLELGSIVFKTLITNPSEKISQEVPVKYYLPKEIKRENVLEIDKELTVNFDAEKDQYFASGNFELKPGESKTLTIRVDDAIFAFNEDEINGIKKQAEELAEPLKNTSYFAQGATLKSDIDVSLNKVLSLQKAANTPEEKIRAYREGKIIMDSTGEKLDKLKEIATSSGSASTLLGFVGGAQVLAVWGLVIILITGFVGLALYLRMIRGGSLKGQESDVKNQGRSKTKSFDEEFELEQKKKGHKGLRLAVVSLITVIGVGVAGGFIAMNIGGSQTARSQVSDVNESKKVVLGEATESGKLQEDLKGEEVQLFVPNESLVVVLKEPTIDSEVLADLGLSQSVQRLGTSGSWTKVVIDRGQSEKIVGWVDGDFIEVNSEPEVVETSKVTQAVEKVSSGILKLVTVLDTPTGFLRVRSGPGGKELGKIDPGKKYPVLESKSGWLNILLDDGTSGWVSGKYTDFSGRSMGGINEL